MTDMSPPIFKVASVVPRDAVVAVAPSTAGGSGVTSGTIDQQAKTDTGSSARYVRTTGLSRRNHRSSPLPPPPSAGTDLVAGSKAAAKAKAKAKAGSAQGRQQHQQRRSSTPGGNTSSSRAVIHAGTNLPKPYTYEPLTHSTIETVPLNTDYPTGSCTINHAAGAAEPRQFYHRFKSTYGRPELTRHGKTGYYDFRPIEVDVVRAKKTRGNGWKRVGRRNTTRSLRIGKPVRRSVGLSTLWAWDFPPPWVFEVEQVQDTGGESSTATSNKHVGWIDCEPSVDPASVTQRVDGDHGSVAGGGSVAGSVASCGSIFFVDNMKRPGAQVGFGGPFPYDRFLRPEQDPYYRAGSDDDDADDGERGDTAAKVNHHMDSNMLYFAALPYSFEQCWADQMNFADFDGLKARESLHRPYPTPSAAPPTTSRSDRPQFPTQELLRPTPEHVERAKKIHQAARIKARQHQNKMSRVSDWRHRSAALEAEINRRRSMRRGAVGIKEIYINDDTVSIDAEELSLPGVLKVMAALKPDSVDAHSTTEAEALNEDGSTIEIGSLGDYNEQKDIATDASTTVEGLNYLSDGSTILHYLERYQCDEKKNLAEESIAELAEDGLMGLEEDSREDSAEIKLFLDDDDIEDENEDEDEDEADDSLAFSRTTSIAEVLANAALGLSEKRRSESSSISTPTADIVAQSKVAREERTKAGVTSDGAKDSDASTALPRTSKSALQTEDPQEPPAENLEGSSSTCRPPRSRPLSIRLSAKKKKAWDNAWGEAGVVSDMVAVARWHGEDDVPARTLNDLCSTKDTEGVGNECRETDKGQVLPMVIPCQGEESHCGESTRKDGILRTAKTTAKGEEDDAPPGSPTVSQLPPRGKISSSPPRPTIKKAAKVGVSLSEHLAATGASGGSCMLKAGCEGSIRTMETACSTNPSEDDFVPSPYASGRKNIRSDALAGASARSRRRAVEAQFSKQLSNSSRSGRVASRNDPAASLESARSLEVAILQSLKKKVDDSIGTSSITNTKDMMRRIQNERNRVAQKSKSLRALDGTPQQAGTAPDWNVW